MACLICAFKLASFMGMRHSQATMDHSFMQRALELAARGIGGTHPNPRVGAVVVKDGVIIGEGWHEKPGMPHAEPVALKAAGEAARGATLYVTLEPCAAHGRTPPCTEAVLAAGIARIVYASSDPNPKMAGGGEVLKAKGLEVVSGVLQAEADQLNSAFFHYLTSGMPYVTAKAAISLDGKMATHTGHSQWISGSESRLHAHALRAASDAIVVGAGTFIHDNPSLTVRDVPSPGKAPLRVLFAKQTPPFSRHCKMLSEEAPSRFYVREYGENDILWHQAGMEIVTIDDPTAMLKHLAEDGCLSVLVEGGGRLHAQVLQAHLAQELVLYQAPLLIGGVDAPGLWHGQGVARMPEALRVDVFERRLLGDDQLIRGRILYN